MSRTELISTIKEQVRKALPGAKIILYGSEARREARADSDIDILILLDKKKVCNADRSIISDILYDLELETGTIISPLIYSEDEWNNRPFKTPFFINVMNEGIEL